MLPDLLGDRLATVDLYCCLGGCERIDLAAKGGMEVRLVKRRKAEKSTML